MKEKLININNVGLICIFMHQININLRKFDENVDEH